MVSLALIRGASFWLLLCAVICLSYRLVQARVATDEALVLVEAIRGQRDRADRRYLILRHEMYVLQNANCIAAAARSE